MDDKATTNIDRFDKIDERLDVLSTQLDSKFSRIDDKFDKIDQRFLKVDQQFDKLTLYMLKRFDNVDRKLDEKADNGDMQIALGLLDSISKRQETYNEERLVMGHQISRIDVWTHELANKIGHKLSA